MTRKIKQHGFSLIELMIVLVIIVILTSIAFPTFTKQIESTRRTEAKTALLDFAAKFEDYYSSNYSYTGADTFYSLNSNPETENGYYEISAAITNDGDGFTLTATAQGTQSNDANCLTMTLDHTNSKTPTSCW